MISLKSGWKAVNQKVMGPPWLHPSTVLSPEKNMSWLSINPYARYIISATQNSEVSQGPHRGAVVVDNVETRIPVMDRQHEKLVETKMEKQPRRSRIWVWWNLFCGVSWIDHSCVSEWVKMRKECPHQIPQRLTGRNFVGQHDCSRELPPNNSCLTRRFLGWKKIALTWQPLTDAFCTVFSHIINGGHMIRRSPITRQSWATVAHPRWKKSPVDWIWFTQVECEVMVNSASRFCSEKGLCLGWHLTGHFKLAVEWQSFASGPHGTRSLW